MIPRRFSQLTGHQFLMEALRGYRDPSFWQRLGPKHVERLQKILQRAKRSNDMMSLCASAVVALAGTGWALYETQQYTAFVPSVDMTGCIVWICGSLLGAVATFFTLSHVLGTNRIVEMYYLLTPLLSSHPRYERAMYLLKFESPRRYQKQIEGLRRYLVHGDVERMEELAALDAEDRLEGASEMRRDLLAETAEMSLLERSGLTAHERDAIGV